MVTKQSANIRLFTRSYTATSAGPVLAYAKMLSPL